MSMHLSTVLSRKVGSLLSTAKCRAIKAVRYIASKYPFKKSAKKGHHIVAQHSVTMRIKKRYLESSGKWSKLCYKHRARHQKRHKTPVRCQTPVREWGAETSRRGPMRCFQPPSGSDGEPARDMNVDDLSTRIFALHFARWRGVSPPCDYWSALCSGICTAPRRSLYTAAILPVLKCSLHSGQP